MYKGEKVLLDWKNGIRPVLFMQYQLPSGENLIHESPYPMLRTTYIGTFVISKSFSNLLKHIFSPYSVLQLLFLSYFLKATGTIS